MFAPRKRRPLRPSVLSLENLCAASNLVPGLPPAEELVRASAATTQVDQRQSYHIETSRSIASEVLTARPRRVAESRQSLTMVAPTQPTATTIPLISVSDVGATIINPSPRPNSIAITSPTPAAQPLGVVAGQPALYGGGIAQSTIAADVGEVTSQSADRQTTPLTQTPVQIIYYLPGDGTIPDDPVNVTVTPPERAHQDPERAHQAIQGLPRSR